MTTTTNFGFNIPDGTDNVNLLTQNYPNWTNLDAILKAIKDTGVTTATATKTGTNFAVVRNDTDCNFFRFVATANYVSGDTFTVDGVPVTATSAAGTALPSGAFVINQSVIAIVNSGVLTVLVGGGLSSVDASDVDYDNTGSGLTATDVQAAIDEVVSDIPTGFAATAITYDNTGSGLTATDVQAAIDELKTLIPTTPTYITTGLQIISNRCTITSGGYYISNGYCYVDITFIMNVGTGGGTTDLISDFPASAATGDVDVTTTFNNAKIAHVSSGDVTKLYALPQTVVGATVHFIGSYQIR